MRYFVLTSSFRIHMHFLCAHVNCSVISFLFACHVYAQTNRLCMWSSRKFMCWTTFFFASNISASEMKQKNWVNRQTQCENVCYSVIGASIRTLFFLSFLHSTTRSLSRSYFFYATDNHLKTKQKKQSTHAFSTSTWLCIRIGVHAVTQRLCVCSFLA